MRTASGAGLGSRYSKVKLLEKLDRRGKLKVRFMDGPYPGLEDYVTTRQLVVPWGERQPFLRDEEREQRLLEYGREARDPAVAEAASTVLAASGEPSAGVGENGYLWMREDELQRIADRAGLEPSFADLHPLGFRDRHGNIHLPLEAAVAIARAFAAAEPETVVMYIDDRESELKVSGFQPGYRYRHDLLRQYAPGFALARQWAGTEQEAEMLRKEIGRLRALVSQAAGGYEVASLAPRVPCRSPSSP